MKVPTLFPRNEKARCCNCVKMVEIQGEEHFRCAELPHWSRIDEMWLNVHYCFRGLWWARLGDNEPWLVSLTDICEKHEVLTPIKRWEL